MRLPESGSLTVVVRFQVKVQGPLAADEQGGEVVAGHALACAAPGPQARALAGDDLEPEHPLAGDAILERAGAAGIFRDGPADGAHLVAVRIGRVEPVSYTHLTLPTIYSV